MAWKGRTVAQSDFTQLIKALDNSRIQTENNALYQVLFQLVQAAQKNKDITVNEFVTLTNLIDSISNTNISNTNGLAALLLVDFITKTDQTSLLVNSIHEIAGTLLAFDDTTPGQRTINVDNTPEYLTGADESVKLPNSRQLLAGTNITFDDSVPNQRTINATGGGSGTCYVPLANGIEPMQFMSDGLGQPILVSYTP